jgi:hypothetical protein
MSSNAVNIDLAAIQAEIQNLSPEEIQKQLVELRTKQRVNQAKHHNTEKQKQYMAKRNAGFKLMAERAKAAPRTDGKAGTLYDQILEQAKVNAAEVIAQNAAAEDTSDVEDSELVDA